MPEIRFKDFKDKWKHFSFKEITYKAGIKNSENLSLESYSISNELGFIPQKEQFENGGTMSKADKRMYYIVSSNSFAYNPARINVGSLGYYQGVKDVIVSSLYEVFKTSDIVDDIFLLYWFKTTIFKRMIEQYQEGGVRLYFFFDKLQKCQIKIPSLQEQKKIASYFKKLDSLIQTTSRKLESLKKIKAASLQSMFPQEGETVPKVRFKGFEGEWEKEKLSKLLVERHEISTITDKLPQLSFTISEGIIYPDDRKSNKRDFLIKDIVNKKYLITYVGDIIYNPANVIYGAIHRNSLCNGVVSPIYKIFSTEQDSNFMECIVRNPTFISQLSMKTEGTVTKLKTLKPESFLEMIVKIAPSIKEQQKIASYFCNLDKQIFLQTQRLEKLKQIKAACLDKMFV